MRKVGVGAAKASLLLVDKHTRDTLNEEASNFFPSVGNTNCMSATHKKKIENKRIPIRFDLQCDVHTPPQPYLIQTPEAAN